MEYKINIYKKNEGNTERYVLGSTNGDNVLVVIGLNPSTADETKPDPTIRKVMGIAEGAKKSGFIMLNLYPQRATYPSDMDLEFDCIKHANNIKNIIQVFEELNLKEFDILLGFGNNIGSRKYLFNCLKDVIQVLKEYNPKWYKTGDVTKYGHPKHPLYVAYCHGISSFNIEKYIEDNM